jgi:hypothetical protein
MQGYQRELSVLASVRDGVTPTRYHDRSDRLKRVSEHLSHFFCVCSRVRHRKSKRMLTLAPSRFQLSIRMVPVWLCCAGVPVSYSSFKQPDDNHGGVRPGQAWP